MKLIYQVWSGNMLNKKGMTLVEIIISIVLISIVLIFLFVLFINVRDINDEAETNTTFLISKSQIVSAVEKDIINYEELTITTCTIDDITSNYSTSEAKLCFKFLFPDDTESFLGIYYLKEGSFNKNYKGYVATYIHESNKIRETKFFENLKKDKLKYDIKKTNISGKNTMLLKINIIGPDYKDYSLNISYYGNITSNI